MSNNVKCYSLIVIYIEMLMMYCFVTYINTHIAEHVRPHAHAHTYINIYIYTTKGVPSSKFHEFLAGRSQFDSDNDQIWQARADRSGNGSYLNKLAP